MDFPGLITFSAWNREEEVGRWEWTENLKLCFLDSSLLKKRNKIIHLFPWG